MIHNIEIDYCVERDEDTLFEGYFTVKVSDRKLKQIAEFIADDHFTGELVDVPSAIFDEWQETLIEEAIKDVRRECKTALLESDGIYMQNCLPAGLLKLLPTELVEKIDKELIYDYYEVDSMEGVWQWLEENCESNYADVDPTIVNVKKNLPSMKCLAVRQPWAQLIVAGIKDIECRDAMPAPKKPKVFIAASGTKLKWDELDKWVQDIYKKYEAKGVLPAYKDLPAKCIIGYVDIVKASFDPVDSIWGSDWPGMKYTLRNAMMLDEPITGMNKATPYFYNVEGYDEEHLPAAHKVEL